MGTGASLSAPERVRRLQTALHAKAKETPGFRFYSLSDKVWRADVLAVAWQDVRRNGGAAGVDGQTVADIEAYGVERWLGDPPSASSGFLRALRWRSLHRFQHAATRLGSLARRAECTDNSVALEHPTDFLVVRAIEPAGDRVSGSAGLEPAVGQREAGPRHGAVGVPPLRGPQCS